MKVLVKSPFSLYSGYGNDGFGMVRALDRWGADVFVQPVWVDVPIPNDLLHLFTKPLLGPFDLTINHWDPADLGIRPEARQMTRLAVAWTMWEFAGGQGPVEMTNPKTGKKYMADPKPGLVPHCHKRSSLRDRLKWFDLVLGYDDVSLAAIQPYIPRGVTSGVLQGGFQSSEWPVMQRDWFGPRFSFIMHGALNNRKCPLTAVQAFLELKHERPEFASASLQLHTNTPGILFPEMNNIYENDKIKVYIEAWADATLRDFYHAGHCLVAPSRGEGKNLPALEFQSTGGVVAVTNFGGHTQWLREDMGYPLEYTLTPTFANRPDAAHDAKVDHKHLKDVLWHIFTHREEAKQKAELASRLIRSQCDWSVVIEDLFRRIRDLVPHNGELVYNLAMACRKDPREAFMRSPVEEVSAGFAPADA